MRSPICYHYHLEELPNVLGRADTQTPARPSPFDDFHTATVQNQPWVFSQFVEKDEIRKPEKETEKEGS